MKILKNIFILLFLGSWLYAGVPTVTITDDTTGTTNSDVTFTFTFNEDVTGFSADDILVANGAKGTFTGTDNSTVYTLVVTPNQDFVGNIEVDVNAAAAQSVSTNEGNTAPTQYTQAVDTQAPTLTITDNKNDATIGTADGSVTFTFTFSEDVTGFATGDVTVTGGTKGILNGTGDTYTLLVTPNANTQNGTINVNVANNAAIDGVNNGNVGASATQAYDTLAPTISTITDNKTAGTIGIDDGDVTFTFTFSEDVTGFATGDVTVTGGTKGAFSGTGDTYTLVVSPTNNVNNGTIQVSVNAGVAQDALGQTTSNSLTVTQNYDTLAPAAPNTPTLVTDNGSSNNDNITNIDSLNNVTPGLGNIENGATVQYSTDGETTWQNARPTTDGTYALQTRQIDTAGNESPASGILNYTIDKTAGTIAISVIAGDDYINGTEHGGAVTISGTTTGIENGQVVTINFSGNNPYTATVNNNTFSENIPALEVGNTTDGPDNVQVIVQDLAGNQATKTRDFTVDTSAAATINPTSRVMNQKELQDGFTVTVDTDVEDGQTIGVTISGAGITNTLKTSTSHTGGKFYIDFDELTLQDGNQYTLTLSAVTDIAGNNAVLTHGTIMYDQISDTSINSITELTLNQASANSTLHALGGDVDFYILKLPSRGYLSLASNNVDAHVSLHYYDDDNTAISDNDLAANGFKSVLNSGTYYVKVFSGTNKTYNITPTFVAFDEEKDDIAKIDFDLKDTTPITTAISEIDVEGKYLYINSSNQPERISVFNAAFSGGFSGTSNLGFTKVTTHTSNATTYTYTLNGSVIEVKDTSDNIVFKYDEVATTDFFIKDDFLYTIHTGEQMRVYGIGDDLNPQVLGEANIYGKLITVDDRYAYIVDDSNIKIVEVLQDLASSVSDRNEHEIFEFDKDISMNNYAGASDIDVFKIILEKNGDISFTPSNIEVGNTVSLSVSSDDSNLNGDKLGLTVLSNGVAVNINSLPAGAYYVKIEGNNNIVDGKYTLRGTYNTTSDSEIDKVRNYIASSDDITLSTTTQTKSGNIRNGNDVDLFKITAPYSGVLEVSVTNSKTVSLIKAVMTKSDDFSKEENVAIGHIDSGVYFIKVNSATAGDYDVNVKFTPDTPDSDYITALVYDNEIGDRGASIESLYINKQSGEVLYTLHEDDHKFVNKYDIHGINEHQNFEGLNTSLATADGFLLASAIENKYVYFIRVKENKYYLRIFDASKRIYEPVILSDIELPDGVSSDYEFDFSTANQLKLDSATRTYTIDISDRSNPSISSNVAGGWTTDLSVGGTTYSLRNSPETGVDISGGGTINTGGVSATTMTTIGDFLYIGTASQGIYVYNIENKTDPKFVRKITTRQKIKELDSFGTKLFVVSTSLSDANNELLDVLDVSNDYSDYKLESSTIYHNANISGTVVQNDVDYFNVVLNATGDVNLSINSSDVNCTMSNLDDTFTQSCNSLVSNVSSGTYYIKLENKNVANTTNYTFSTSQSYDDHIDTLSLDANKKHTVIASGATTSGNIVTTSDKDVFKLIVDEKATLSIDELSAGFSAKVYYDGGDEIALNGGEYNIYKAGTYYIEITNTTTTGNYSFKTTLDTNKVSAFVDSSSTQNKYLATTATNGEIKAMKVLGDYIYLIDSVDGLVIVDITKTNKPVVKNKISLFGQGKNLIIEGSYAYVSEGEDGIEIFDVSDKSSLKLIGRYNTLGNASDIAVDSTNNKLYVADGANGVVKLDMSNPSKLTLDTTLSKTSNSVASLFMYDGKLYAADNLNGLLVYENDTEQTNLSVSGTFSKIIRNNDTIYAIVAKEIRAYKIGTTLELQDTYADTNVILTVELVNNIAYVDDLLYVMTNTKLVVLDVADSTNMFLEKQVLELYDNSGESLGDTIMTSVDNSLDNLFYGKNGQLHILELSPDYADVFKNAQEINGFPYSKKGQILTSRSEDKDIFKLTTKYSGKITINSTLATVSGKVSLYDANSEGMATLLQQDDITDVQWNTITPVATDDDTANLDFNITDKTLNQGTFYIVIEDALASGKTGGNYQLNVDFNTSGDAYADVIDDNITNLIGVNGGIVEDSLFSGGGDKDFIDISIVNRVNLKFTLAGETKPRITLFYPDGTQMNVSTDENATTYITEISEGDYKVRFDGYDALDEGDYKVTLSTTPVEDILVENGLSKVDIDKILDVNYLGNNIYTITQNSVARYTHLIKELTNTQTSFIANDSNISDNTNYKVFAYASNEQNKIINYIVTTRLDGLQPIVSSVTMDTLDTQSVVTSTNIAPDILPYLQVKHVSENQLLYMYDGSTIQVRKMDETDNANMRAHSFGNLKDIKVVSTATTDIAYVIDSDGGYDILEVQLDSGDGTIAIDSKKGYTKIFNEIGAIFVDTKNNRLYMSVDDGEKKLIYYDVSDIENIVRDSNELVFTNEEYEGVPSDIYVRDVRIYMIIPAQGIVVADLNDDGTLSTYTTILNLGKDIDNIFSMDGRTLNYTNVENNSTRLKIYFFEESFQDGESDGVYTSLKEGNKPKEGCFIATAAYGSYFESHVKVLREFRDGVLLTNSVGKQIVATYYEYSPSIASFIATSESLKMIVRVVLTPIVYMIQYPLYSLLGVLVLLYIRRELKNKKGVIVR